MIPSLPRRFLAPDGWQTGRFDNPDTGHRIHFGHVAPTSGQPRATIVCLGGLSEFAEKYFELAHDMLDRGHEFWFIDWQFQGRSGRLANNPQRRHSDGFDADMSDLHHLLEEHIIPAAQARGTARPPLFMVAHSMGAHIGTLYLHAHPGRFAGAALSAPFYGIYNFTWPLRLLATFIAPIVPLVGRMYVFGGHDWRESNRRSDGTDIFSHDAVRDTLHNIWSKSDEDLHVGSVTFGWVVQALRSCTRITAPGFVERIKIPVTIAIAGEDRIVDNNAARLVAARLPSGHIVDLPGAHHEILMESDEHRDAFLHALDKMIDTLSAPGSADQ